MFYFQTLCDGDVVLTKVQKLLTSFFSKSVDPVEASYMKDCYFECKKHHPGWCLELLEAYYEQECDSDDTEIIPPTPEKNDVAGANFDVAGANFVTDYLEPGPVEEKPKAPLKRKLDLEETEEGYEINLDFVDAARKKQPVSSLETEPDLSRGKKKRKHHEKTPQNDFEVPELDFIDIEDKDFCFQGEFTLKANIWNFFEVPAINLNTAGFMMSRLVTSGEDEYWCWAIQGVTIRIPAQPISAGIDHIEIAVTDENGPAMIKIPAVNAADLADKTKPIIRTHEKIAAGKEMKDTLKYILAENKKAKKPTYGYYFLPDNPAHVASGGSNNEMFVLDCAKNDVNPSVSYYLSRSKAVGGGVAPVGDWPNPDYATGVVQLQGKQAMGANSANISPELPSVNFRTPSRFFPNKQDYFPIFTGKGPWVAIQTTNIQQRIRSVNGSTPVMFEFQPKVTVRVQAKLVKIQDKELSKYLLDKFWMDNLRVPGRGPIVVPPQIGDVTLLENPMMRWDSPTDIEAIKQMQNYDPIKIMGSLGRFEHVFRGICFLDPKEEKDLRDRLSYAPEETNKIQMYVTALKTSKGKHKLNQLTGFY